MKSAIFLVLIISVTAFAQAKKELVLRANCLQGTKPFDCSAEAKKFLPSGLELSSVDIKNVGGNFILRITVIGPGSEDTTMESYVKALEGSPLIDGNLILEDSKFVGAVAKSLDAGSYQLELKVRMITSKQTDPRETMAIIQETAKKTNLTITALKPKPRLKLDSGKEEDRWEISLSGSKENVKKYRDELQTIPDSSVDWLGIKQ